MAAPKTYSIIIVPSDHSGTRQFRISRVLLIALIVVVALLLVTMTIFAATYTSVLAEARRAQVLELQNEQLALQVQRVDELSSELEAISALRAQVLNMLGTEEDDVTGTSSTPAQGTSSWDQIMEDPERLNQLFAEQARKSFAPRAWPSEGRVRREFFAQPEGSVGAHPGLTIDPRAGEAVKSAGAGRVVEIRSDDPSGQSLEIDHGYGFRTLYRGLQRIDVGVGQIVAQGQPLGVVQTEPRPEANPGSRNGDRALYFELRVDGTPVDPRAYLTPR